MTRATLEKMGRLDAFKDYVAEDVAMAIAIIVLTWLQPKAKLLGLAAYDEAGRLVHHQGDFRLDDLTVRGMLSALGTNGQPELHGFTFRISDFGFAFARSLFSHFLPGLIVWAGSDTKAVSS